MRISLDTAIHEANATLLYQKDGSGIVLTGAASDTRLVKEGDLFVCIKGNTVDGHDFATEAMEHGAKAVLAEYNPFASTHGNDTPIPVLLVDDSVKALGRLANKRRHAFTDNQNTAQHLHNGHLRKVIAITGTAGKTSLKELVAHILSIDEQNLEPNALFVAKNRLNHNTQVGMPLTILNARGDEKYWVLELGISHSHDMDELGAIAEPDIAVILNASTGHAEGLGEKGVPYYKARLIHYLAPNGIALVSHDYPQLVQEAKQYQKDIRFFSTQENLHHTVPTGTYLGINADGTGRYALDCKGLGTKSTRMTTRECAHKTQKHKTQTSATQANGTFHAHDTIEVNSVFIGVSGAENCIAAACVAKLLDTSWSAIKKGIETMPSPHMRFNRLQLGTWSVIDDSYNANPLSCLRMLEASRELAKNDKFFVVLGEMKELGHVTKEEHIKLGKAIATLDVDTLFWVGQQGEYVQEGLTENAFTGSFIPLSSSDEFIPNLKQRTHNLGHENKLILFKGSRSNHIETYVKTFTEHCNAL